MCHDIIDSDLAKIQSQLDRNHGTLYVPNDGVMIGNSTSTIVHNDAPKMVDEACGRWMDGWSKASSSIS